MQRRIVCLGLLALVAMAPAFASPINCNSSGSYQDLLNANSSGGCIIGDLLFNNFTFQFTESGGAPTPAPNQFGYLTINNGVNGVGFDFTYAFSVGATQAQDAHLTYTATLLSGQPFLITDAHVSLTGGNFGNAFWILSETFCTNGNFGCTGANANHLNVFSPNQDLSMNFTNGTTSVAVTKDFNINGGAAGFASVSDWTNTLTQTQTGVPEPAGMLLLGSGLTVLGFVVRKTRKS
jgi:hypothetical protein